MRRGVGVKTATALTVGRARSGDDTRRTHVAVFIEDRGNLTGGAGLSKWARPEILKSVDLAILITAYRRISSR
jgi:hypothetical protein